MQALLLKSLIAAAPLLIVVVGALAIKAIQALVAKTMLELASHRRTAPLAPAVKDLGDALDAGILVAEQEVGKRPALVVVRDAAVAAEGVLVADKAALLEDAKNELNVLVTAPVTITIAPGGGTVNMPEPK